MRCIIIKSKVYLAIVISLCCIVCILNKFGIISTVKLNTKIDVSNIGLILVALGLLVGNLGSKTYKNSKKSLNEIIRKNILKDNEITVMQAMFRLRNNTPVYMEDIKKGLYVKISYENGVGKFEHLNSGIVKTFDGTFLNDVKEIFNDGYKVYDVGVLDILKRKGYKFKNGNR